MEERAFLATLACAPYVDHMLLADVRQQPIAAEAAAAEQYVIHQTPRLQPGNAPLVGTPAYQGKDQIDILWQTKTVGAGTSDSFVVRYRRTGMTEWMVAPLNAPLALEYHNPGDRTIHSATILGLEWNTDYQYLVQHLRGSDPVVSFDGEFQTRLAPGDTTSFTFTAYGDSSWPTTTNLDFKAVQSRINELNPRFNLLLGDNFYEWGTHDDADSRFAPTFNEPATEWIAEHIDYFTIGNHDGTLNPHQGQPSRDSYSVPIPIAGVNAYASPPAADFPEHNYSFDFGGVHFVSLDTNPVELQDQAVAALRTQATLEYAIADLKASKARWKVVFTHHPIAGTDKSYDEVSGMYFQKSLPMLREAGVDLLLVGDSHTYSWTYPLRGFSDSNSNGVIEVSEVHYDGRSRYELIRGAGLVQVVSGVGGRSLRPDGYEVPFIAAAYSTATNTFPLEYGFSQIDVLTDRLVVSYLSAKTGKIVGDLNENGRMDANEPYFGQFQILDDRPTRGDINRDDILNVADIDTMCAAILAGQSRPDYDLDGDSLLTREDYRVLTEEIFRGGPGDANLDGRVNSQDLVQIFQAGRYMDERPNSASWAEGDWNCDGKFDTTDLVVMSQAGKYES